MSLKVALLTCPMYGIRTIFTCIPQVIYSGTRPVYLHRSRESTVMHGRPCARGGWAGGGAMNFRVREALLERENNGPVLTERTHGASTQLSGTRWYFVSIPRNGRLGTRREGCRTLAPEDEIRSSLRHGDKGNCIRCSDETSSRGRM